ncbi:MAG TPA: DUF5522 domain-containing protein [Cytophagaceae bacterium]|jgi:hypothetical protein|nr:DUF5522 domain-containing protein [Cytophagaceae bacterium]
MLPTSKSCSSCQAVFQCGCTSNPKNCWCIHFPTFSSPLPDLDCFCPECLKKLTTEKVNHYKKTLADTNQLAKAGDLLEGIDFYTEKDTLVFTAWFHIQRGFCCRNGCRHCPY